MELLLGCGSNPRKQVWLPGESPEWNEVVRLDLNGDHDPDVVWDLTQRPLPFEDETFDEIHAYEVLEHLGQQGDYRAWFSEWDEWYRLLKPDGRFYGSSPHHSSPWQWGDPGHTRSMGSEQMVYLDRTQYAKQIGKTAMTDYRFCYDGDFSALVLENREGVFYFVMQAVKPAR